MGLPSRHGKSFSLSRHHVATMIHRSIKLLVALLLAPLVLAVLWIAVFGWNWARGPLQSIVAEQTGRELVIGGDLKVSLGWPSARVHAAAVSFANPAWARQKQMIAVDDVEFSVDLPELLRQNLVFPEVRLIRPLVSLEQAADGRKTWLLDRAQADEAARIPIGRLMLDRGRLEYDDARQRTRIGLDLSTQDLPGGAPGAAAGGAASGVTFSAEGFYKGLAIAAHGSGGSVLALNDERVPYPLNFEAKLGHTGIKAAGTITSLLKFSAIDMQMALHGESLAQLYPLLGIALPETHPYAIAGHLVHSGKSWRYEKFSGRTGSSDIAGSLQVDTGGARPFMRGELVSKMLDIDDLGPLIGARKNLPALAVRKPAAAPAAGSGPRLLPDIPFKTERWSSVDADVSLRATTIRRAKELPLENLVTHLKMQNSLLILDPLDFGFAGGHLKALIELDGRNNPIKARARIGARQIVVAKLFPTIDVTKTSIGQINGEFDLAGQGNSVGRMLATADGRIGLFVVDGKISKLLMEKLGLHLLEIMQLKLAGDRTIDLRCAVADFAVKGGVMQARTLLLDTEISTVTGGGSIDLGQETLDLILVPKTRNTSLVALRSPIHVGGTFSSPQVDLDLGRVAARGAGALALALINPLLALIPLVEAGPGKANECARLIHEAQARLPTDGKAVSARATPKGQ